MSDVIPTPPRLVGAGRRVALRTRGRAHGPVVRFVSANDLGETIKPFVFLDPAFSRHLLADDIPSDGPARVLIGAAEMRSVRLTHLRASTFSSCS